MDLGTSDQARWGAEFTADGQPLKCIVRSILSCPRPEEPTTLLLISSHTDSPHPKATFLPGKHSCTGGLTLVSSSHIYLYEQPKCCVSGEVSASGLQETEAKETGSEEMGQMAIPTAQGAVFFNNSAYCKQN